MAATTNAQPGWWDMFSNMLSNGQSGTESDLSTGMTVPTAYNTSAQWAPPGAPANGVSPQGTGLGFNVGTGQLALSGLGALAGIWGASQQNKLAKDQFKFQKDLANINLNNQMKSYNTALEDRMTARGAMEGRDAAYTASEIDRRKLSR